MAGTKKLLSVLPRGMNRGMLNALLSLLYVIEWAQVSPAISMSFIDLPGSWSRKIVPWLTVCSLPRMQMALDAGGIMKKQNPT